MANTYSAGIATAYGAAVRGGYTGTYDEWCALMADYATVGESAEQAAQNAAASANAAATSESNAATSEQNAAASESAASAAATDATEARADAQTAAGAASVSADNADASALAAAQSASAASTSASAAAGDATAAAGSASAAAQTLTDVNAAGAAQISDIDAEGERVLASIPADYTDLAGEVSDLKSQLDANATCDASLAQTLQTAMSGADVDIKKFYPFYRGSVNTSSGQPEMDQYRAYCKIPVSINDDIYFDATKYKAYFVIYRANGDYVSTGWATSSPYHITTSTASYTYVVLKRADSDTNVVDIDDAMANTYTKTSVVSNLETKNIKYIASNGADTNDGSFDYPLQTVNKALEMGAETIFIAPGVYWQQIDLSKAKKQRVNLLNTSTDNNVTFTYDERKIATSETQTSGYTKVYQTFCNKTFATGNKWIFQENWHDASTEIENTERLPQQRGVQYRCYDVKIVKCSASTLSDALAEIEAATDYRWYLDSGTLYYSRPTTVNNNNPISYSDGRTLFTNNSKSVSVTIVGITARFMNINITSMIAPKVVDCKVYNCFSSGGIDYSNSMGTEIIRCETARVFSGSTGDGINAHGATTGHVRAKKTTATISDCWSHDNNDDGFSDHECCESVIYGGLFEYNGKAGVTPSYGSHCVCYQVISRHNYNGFFYTGAATQAEGGAYGQVLLFGCVSRENTRGIDKNHAGYLVEGTGNRMICHNCKSIGNQYGYYASSGTIIDIVDCTSLNDGTVKVGGGTKNVVTTVAVS